MDWWMILLVVWASMFLYNALDLGKLPAKLGFGG